MRYNRQSEKYEEELMTIIEKLVKLRALMKERNMDAYIIPTSDFHETEYVGEHFKARAYMSGFTGSQGVLIVCLDRAALWTDGRYFIQAEDQLKDTTIELMKQGEEGVPTIEEYLKKNLNDQAVLGFDGRVMNTASVNRIQTALLEQHVSITCDEDLVGMIWEDRPALPSKQGFYLHDQFSGKRSEDKINDIQVKMKEEGATHHILTSLDDIAWILNIRGWDIAHFPVVLSYFVITMDEHHLFVDAKKLDEDMMINFRNNHIQIHPYDDIYTYVKTIDEDASVLLNSNVVNYAITRNLPKDIKVIDKTNPSQLMKAIKNTIELENNRVAHVKDAVAMCKFMYWLKTNIGKLEISEISASDYLRDLRMEQENCIDLSFETISAYHEHAAMMHYSASEESNVNLQANGMLLVDSGAQFLEGTTDITRTFVLGPITDEMKLYFTAALRGMISLSKAHFLYGCRGVNLDILARGPLWEMGMDYKCGTGHGVGHLLNVHEGPNGFRWKIVAERNDSCVLEEGMTQSNEPGVYIEGNFGIRHENEMVVRKGEKNEYGQYMYFETITFVPFDLDGVDTDLLTVYEKAWLNNYHAQVYEKVSPSLTDEERVWLKEATRAI